MTRRDQVAPYLPTLKRARQELTELPPGAPTERHQLAALIVGVRLLRRETWREKAAVTTHRASRLPRTVPAGRLKGTVTTLHRLLYVKPCDACRGRDAPKPTCRRCVAQAELDHHTDKLLSMRETYVPAEVTSVPAMFSFESALEAMLPKRPPECLRCYDLRPQAAGGAYREAQRKRQPTFFGHQFGDTIDAGREAVAQFMRRGTIIAHETRAYAWPFLWLRYGVARVREEIVVLADARGKLHTFVGAAPDG